MFRWYIMDMALNRISLFCCVCVCAKSHTHRVIRSFLTVGKCAHNICTTSYISFFTSAAGSSVQSSPNQTLHTLYTVYIMSASMLCNLVWFSLLVVNCTHPSLSFLYVVLLTKMPTRLAEGNCTLLWRRVFFRRCDRFSLKSLRMAKNYAPLYHLYASLALRRNDSLSSCQKWF